ncbi:MAG: MFS transporter [Coprococcus sp.]
MYFISMAIPTYGVSVLNARMVQATGMNSSIIGIGVSLATLMQGISAPIVGSIIRKKGVRIPFITGTIMVMTGCFLMAYFTMNEICFIMYYGIFMGVGMGFAGMLSLQSSINLWFDRRKSLAMGIAMSAGGLAGLVLPILLGAVSDKSSWEGGWLFSGIMCIIPCLVAIFIVINKPEDIGEIPDGLDSIKRREISAVKKENSAKASNIPTIVKKELSLNHIYKSSAFYVIAFNVAAKWMLYYAFTGHIVIYLMQNNVDKSISALAISSFSIASLIGRLLIGLIPESVLPPRNNNAFGTIIFCTGMTALLLMPLSAATICISTAVMGFTFGTTMIGFPIMVSETFGSNNFPVLNAKMALIQNVLGAVGPLATGLIATALNSYNIAYWIFIVLALASGITLLFMKTPDKNNA